MKLFPFVLIRISGGPFEELQKLQFHKTSEISSLLASALDDFEVLQARICETLFAEISHASDPAQRLLLINLKRNVFNGRAISGDRFESYINSYAQIGRLRQQGETTYNHEMIEVRSRLRSLSTNEDLQKGLLLSSQALIKSLPAYLRNASNIYDSKERKTELGLMRFISRMYAKTSPFSTFTNLSIAKIAGDAEQILKVAEGSETISSHVKINNDFVGQLKQIFIKNPEVYRLFDVALNPSIREEGENYLFLTNTSNVESFQRLTITEPLKIILSRCAQPIVYSNLLHSLSESIDAETEEIEQYVDQLIEYGFLEFQIEISRIDQVAAMLQELRSAADEFSRSGAARRGEILTDAFSRFKAIHADAEAAEEHSWLRPENIFYEDTTRNLEATLSEIKLHEIVSCVNAFLQNTPLFDQHKEAREKIRKFFETKYGASACIDLLTFYEDYFREIKKTEAEGTQSISAFRQKRDSWIRSFLSSIQDQFESDEISVSVRDLQAPDKVQKSSSYGAFLQFFADGENWKAVVNATFPGYGKMISRFLQLFDPSITEEAQRWNAAMAGETIFAENTDASFFNANLHPPLLPFEIWMPGGQNMLPKEKQIRVTDLAVSVNEQSADLQLIHKNLQKRVYVFDVTFQGEINRSPLFRLLGNFTLAQQHFFQPLFQALNDSVHVESNPGIRIQPRVIIDNTIVIQRKSWIVPKQLLLVRAPNESDWEFFARIDRWRLQNKIPNEVFVFAAQPDEIRQHKHLTLDDTKPQYVCFRNPLLVNLLEKAIARVPTALRVEEMLPNSEQLMALSSGHYVTEFVVQWYNES